MKIFYKKDFQRVLGELNALKIEFKDYRDSMENKVSILDTQCFELIEEKSELLDTKLKYETQVAEYNNELTALKIGIESLRAELKEKEKEKAKLEKKIAKLDETKAAKETEISDLKAQIEELKSDRYRVRTIPAGRTKNVNKTSIRSSARESRVIKYVKDNL